MAMHEGETPTSIALVRRLLRAQFPEWAGLPIEHVPSSGTVNALYRLGDEMVARLPRTDWGVGAVDKELRWLPELSLPVKTPIPLARGEPGEGYPFVWGVYPWLQGEHPEAGAAPPELARELAGLVRTLHVAGTPAPAPRGRGSIPLQEQDPAVRAALAQLDDMIDTATAAAAWDGALAAPVWRGARVWTHGDLMPANLLVRDGRLTGVLDWECMGLGDPACDLAVAWNLLPAASRDVFRAELDVEDATWVRGRGWALWTGLVALPYYRVTNPVLAENARYRIGEVLGDFAASGRGRP